MSEPKVTRRKLTEYTPDPQNANAGTERGARMLEDSVQEVGAGRSLVASADGVIVAGNKTLQALADAQITDVLEVETDGHTAVVVKRTDWDSRQHPGAQRYAYLDNQSGAVDLQWDVERLAADLASGFDFDGIFYDWELDTILGKALEDQDPDKLWEGMPEFEQETIKPFKTMLIHFMTLDDLKSFAALIEQSITEQTRAIYYPKQENLHWKEYYAAVDENES